MMADYENETCVDCKYWEMAKNEEPPYCWFHGKPHDWAREMFVCAPGSRCNDFAPSLECRKTLALESISIALDCIQKDTKLLCSFVSCL